MHLVAQIIARYPAIRLLSASNGASGVEIARTSQPDVILMDIKLPGISGFEVLQILQLDPLTSHIPVVAVSANAVNLDVERGLKAGFFDYITKPIKVSGFMASLELAMKFADDNKLSAVDALEPLPRIST
jgi:CheY-like chemotaxis protein